jgi:hypothetical protein
MTRQGNSGAAQERQLRGAIHAVRHVPIHQTAIVAGQRVVHEIGKAIPDVGVRTISH